MTLAFGSFDESYPPEVLRGYVAPVLSGGAARRSGASASELVVTAGTPGSYEPEVGPKDRPRNVTELRESSRPATREPWPAGAYVLVGTTGKRAHWSGVDWHSDASPGYEPAEVEVDGVLHTGTLPVEAIVDDGDRS